MAGQWLVHGSEAERERLVAAVEAFEPGARAVFVDDPSVLRALVRTMPDKGARVALGEDSSVEPVNLAAALVADGHTAEVLLVTEAATGSLRSRASQAGVSRVATYEEADIAARSVARVEGSAVRAEPGAPVPATMDEGGGVPPREAPTGAGGRAPGHHLQEGEAPAIVLASARGGVGKSAIAATMAVEAASWGMDVALVDLDLTFGNLYGYFGEAEACDLSPLADGWSEAAVDKAGRSVAQGVTLYGPCARPEFAEAVAPVVGRLIDYLRTRHDLVVVDGSTVWGDALAQAVQGADRLALVADERAGAIGSLARAAALTVRLGVARTRIVRVMNRCDPRRRDDGFLARANVGLETARSFRVVDGGFDVGELLGTGHARELSALGDDFVRSCRSMTAKLLADLGRLPDVPEARKARDLKLEPRSGFLRFAREAV